MAGVVEILRKAYKRAPAVLRKPYKRGRPPANEVLPPLPPRDVRPRWFREALLTGSMRCPRKWADIALELCAQIQDMQPAGCAALKCAFFGKRDLLLEEVKAAKKSGIAPKTGSRGKLVVLQGDGI